MSQGQDEASILKRLMSVGFTSSKDVSDLFNKFGYQGFDVNKVLIAGVKNLGLNACIQIATRGFEIGPAKCEEDEKTLIKIKGSDYTFKKLFQEGMMSKRKNKTSGKRLPSDENDPLTLTVGRLCLAFAPLFLSMILIEQRFLSQLAGLDQELHPIFCEKVISHFSLKGKLSHIPRATQAAFGFLYSQASKPLNARQDIGSFLKSKSIVLSEWHGDKARIELESESGSSSIANSIGNKGWKIAKKSQLFNLLVANGIESYFEVVEGDCPTFGGSSMVPLDPKLVLFTYHHRGEDSETRDIKALGNRVTDSMIPKQAKEVSDALGNSRRLLGENAFQTAGLFHKLTLSVDSDKKRSAADAAAAIDKA